MEVDSVGKKLTHPQGCGFNFHRHVRTSLIGDRYVSFCKSSLSLRSILTLVSLQSPTHKFFVRKKRQKNTNKGCIKFLY